MPVIGSDDGRASYNALFGRQAYRDFPATAAGVDSTTRVGVMPGMRHHF
ncbi:hypothetical protein CNECB9_980010 [Cupriavidus necator]|uniref:Uncharacterized protein n=1 Tax=Cupriavidus necator TaxID=106590 RepID=A0A1K0JS15_CUPNE|nr:hypothetical protein CNECB9_980010 [Cupriavidus necator]